MLGRLAERDATRDLSVIAWLWARTVIVAPDHASRWTMASLHLSFRMSTHPDVPTSGARSKYIICSTNCRSPPLRAWGLAKEGERGIFFYFTSPGARGEGRRHFWRYYDLKRNRMLDNRFLITNLIACSPDTPRVVGDADVFAVQEKVIEDILASVQEQQALEAAPKVLDPLQQTVTTLLRSYLSSPVVKRSDVREAMQRLRQPMTHTAVRELCGAYEQFQQDQDVQALVGFTRKLAHSGESPAKSPGDRQQVRLSREDLHLVCFDFVWS